MFKFLEKALGSTSTYYNMLMKTRDKKEAIEPYKIDEVARVLQPLVTECSIIETDTVAERISLNEVSRELENYSAEIHQYDLEVAGVFSRANQTYVLLLNLNKVHRGKHYQKLVGLKQPSGKSSILNTSSSLPIWEEIVHRDAASNLLIKKLAKNQPWTLYRLAAGKLVDQNSNGIQIGGYPQWIINDVDYRTIKDSEFICSYIQEYPAIGLYYFHDKRLDKINFISQNL
ncbi:MAG: hypothetical protein WBA16_00200 [Nonlabens sp.]